MVFIILHKNVELQLFKKNIKKSTRPKNIQLFQQLFKIY